MKKAAYKDIMDFAEFLVRKGKIKDAQKAVAAFAAEMPGRSLDQLCLYWGKWLVAILDQFPEAISNPKNRDELHDWFKFAFCHLKRNDLFEERRVRIGMKIEKALVPFSAGLDALPAADMNQYMNFVKQWCIDNIAPIEEIVENHFG